MREYSIYLKKQNKSLRHNSEDKWTLSNLEAGFEKFYDENGHYPSSQELDNFQYLPSSRQIQRAFGGLQKLRKEMKLEHEALDQNRGKIRSSMSGKLVFRSNDYEENYYKYLINQIPEIYVHEHKVLRYNGNKTDTDFFVYFPDSNNGIAIDLFYAKDIISLLGQTNIKEPKYAPLPYKIYFVSINKEISQDEIEYRIYKKKNKLSENIGVYNIDYFNSKILPSVIQKYKNK